MNRQWLPTQARKVADVRYGIEPLYVVRSYRVVEEYSHYQMRHVSRFVGTSHSSRASPSVSRSESVRAMELLDAGVSRCRTLMPNQHYTEHAELVGQSVEKVQPAGRRPPISHHVRALSRLAQASLASIRYLSRSRLAWLSLDRCPLAEWSLRLWASRPLSQT